METGPLPPGGDFPSVRPLVTNPLLASPVTAVPRVLPPTSLGETPSRVPLAAGGAPSRIDVPGSNPDLLRSSDVFGISYSSEKIL